MAVQVLEVDLGPGIRAGFSTRHGGASRGPWSTANLGSGVGDDPAAIAANLADVTRWLGARPLFGHQVHGAAVRRVSTHAVRRAHDEPGGPSPDVDGQVATRDAGGPDHAVGLGILAADCLPVLFADPGAGVIATAHAGRRGLAAGVLQATVATMLDAGAERGRIRAVIGPGICGGCYEVPAAMRDEVAAVVPGTATTTDRATPALDLAAGARGVLTGLGLGAVADLGICTATDDRFPSYRAAGGPAAPSARFAGLIAFNGHSARGVA